MTVEQIREAVRDGGLLDDGPRGGGREVVAMLSGGRDSVCLLDVLVALRDASAVVALHVNYGLRADADADERHCVALCERLGVELSIVHAARRDHSEADSERAGAAPERAGGNVQAWARDLRYAAARALARSLPRAERGASIATGHTASDQVETILYRLAASPGRRALLGMAPSEGGIVRPLLDFTREQTAAYCRERGLRWREDASNEDERYARARVRATLVPALRSVHPAAERSVLRTARLLREETELLDALVEQELGGRASIALARLGELPPALARLVVVRLAEEAAGEHAPQSGERVDQLLALGRRGGRAELHVGGWAGAVIEDGVLSFRRLAPRETSMRHEASTRPPKRPPGGD
ncbi:MAG TPA: tRNA lysidine(34) synthetase TilS [Solirubrobacteraceae bacterium]|nr:tRNA lysidine(34) synthetase TilS [Solirubrobacteraceae bacterium]